jgi:predicted ester cyclase
MRTTTSSLTNDFVPSLVSLLGVMLESWIDIEAWKGRRIMDTEENIALVLNLYDKFDKGELEQCTETIDHAFVANVLGTTPLDWPGFMRFGSAFLAAFPDGRHIFDYVVAEGENVVTIGKYRGTHRGEMQGIPASGRRLRLPVMHLDRVANGKIVEHLGLANEMDLMRQLGVTMAPKPR